MFYHLLPGFPSHCELHHFSKCLRDVTRVIDNFSISFFLVSRSSGARHWNMGCGEWLCVVLRDDCCSAGLTCYCIGHMSLTSVI